MTWYDYSIAIASFISDLADKMVAEGWTREEAGYNTVKPAGYPSIYFMLESLFSATLIYNDGTATTGPFTYLLVRLAAAYDVTNHRPLETANGGRTRFRMIINATDYSASATKVYNVKGWIDSKTIMLYLKADDSISGYATHVLFVGEVEAVGAAANTVMMLATDYFVEVGTNSTLDQANTDYRLEHHFLHCLGDGYGYLAFNSGIGASGMDNKVRPHSLLIWRLAVAVNQLWNIMYRIPAGIVRVTTVDGVESESDTFVDGAQTFQKMPTAGNQSATGYEITQKTSYYQITTPDYYMVGKWWFRRA